MKKKGRRGGGGTTVYLGKQRDGQGRKLDKRRLRVRDEMKIKL